jgi:hypothetical protein
MVNIACTRCIEAIYTRYKEEKGVVAVGVFVVVVIEGDSCVKKEESAAAELNRRGTVK